MRKVFKHAASLLLIPVTRWFLRKERTYIYDGIKIKIPPTVFHPGLFPSTRFLLSYLKKQELQSKSFLELGCGSGLICLWAAKRKAVVVGCDLNPTAVNASKANAWKNGVEMKIIHSDLFTAIPKIRFDWIVINPPYYSKPVSSDEELAWNCGENFEYFEKLFKQLKDYVHPSSHVAMVLTQGCDIKSIRSIASRNNFAMELRDEQGALFDGRDFIFAIQPNN